jgi:hypothetical protein
VGTTYSADLSKAANVSGGTPPYSFSLVAGSSLPMGLSLSPSSGVVSGTPSGAGTFNFGFVVKDSSGLAQIVKPVVFDARAKFEFKN